MERSIKKFFEVKILRDKTEESYLLHTSSFTEAEATFPNDTVMSMKRATYLTTGERGNKTYLFKIMFNDGDDEFTCNIIVKCFDVLQGKEAIHAWLKYVSLEYVFISITLTKSKCVFL